MRCIESTLAPLAIHPSTYLTPFVVQSIVHAASYSSPLPLDFNSARPHNKRRHFFLPPNNSFFFLLPTTKRVKTKCTSHSTQYQTGYEKILYHSIHIVWIWLANFECDLTTNAYTRLYETFVQLQSPCHFRPLCYLGYVFPYYVQYIQHALCTSLHHQCSISLLVAPPTPIRMQFFPLYIQQAV